MKIPIFFYSKQELKETIELLYDFLEWNEDERIEKIIIKLEENYENS